MREHGSRIGIYFSDFFNLDATVVEAYGAFNVSLVNDLPLFVDPFLLFDSQDGKYAHLHDEIIKYLRFLRDESSTQLSSADIAQWFHFKEIRQNWLGFSREGNSGSGLGAKFAKELNSNLHSVFKGFGSESITRGSHLEKVCLFADGVGRDHLSDFCTNLIKSYLLDYTQTFALTHLRSDQRRSLMIPKVSFDYSSKRWRSAKFTLPFISQDFVLLTPRDMLTRDAAWINRQDLLDNVEDISESIPDNQLRAQINRYFLSKLTDDPSEKERREAAASTVGRFPILLDYYVRLKEDTAADAHRQSHNRVVTTERLFIKQVQAFVNRHLAGTDFYKPDTTFKSSLDRVLFLKHVIEDNDGWRLFYLDGVPVQKEANLQLLYRLTWFATDLDVNREPNNGRGPVDYAVSNGRRDKTLIEFKLAKNRKLKANLQHQVATYETANQTQSSITVILYFNDAELTSVHRILKELKLTARKNIVLIDASPKTSASLLQ